MPTWHHFGKSLQCKQTLGTHTEISYIYRTAEILDCLDFWMHLQENGNIFSSFFLSVPVRHHLHRPAAGAEVRRAGVHPRLHQDLSEHAGLVPRLHLYAVQCPHSAGHDSHQVGVDTSWTNRLTLLKCTDVNHRVAQLEMERRLILNFFIFSYNTTTTDKFISPKTSWI